MTNSNLRCSQATCGPRDDVGSDCAHRHRLSPERGAGRTSPSGVIPFRNLKRSLPVERTRACFRRCSTQTRQAARARRRQNPGEVAATGRTTGSCRQGVVESRGPPSGVEGVVPTGGVRHGKDLRANGHWAYLLYRAELSSLSFAIRWCGSFECLIRYSNSPASFCGSSPII